MSKILWSEIMEANRAAIIEKMLEAYRDACHPMSGWHTGVEMNEDGEVWATGLASQGSQSMSSWNGETFVVKEYQTWEPELDFESMILGDTDEFVALYKKAIADKDVWNSHRIWLKEYYPAKITEYEQMLEDAEVDAYAETVEDVLDEIIRENRMMEQE